MRIAIRGDVEFSLKLVKPGTWIVSGSDGGNYGVLYRFNRVRRAEWAAKSSTGRAFHAARRKDCLEFLWRELHLPPKPPPPPVDHDKQVLERLPLDKAAWVALGMIARVSAENSMYLADRVRRIHELSLTVLNRRD